MSSIETPARIAGPDRDLAHLPVSVFAIVMGVGGTALAWQRAATVFGTSPTPGRLRASRSTGSFP
jgi:tellurite resistance protein